MYTWLNARVYFYPTVDKRMKETSATVKTALRFYIGDLIVGFRFRKLLTCNKVHYNNPFIILCRNGVPAADHSSPRGGAKVCRSDIRLSKLASANVRGECSVQSKNIMPKQYDQWCLPQLKEELRRRNLPLPMHGLLNCY